MYFEPFEPTEILGMADVYTMNDSICPRRNKNYVTLKKEAWDKVQTALREYVQDFGDIVLLDAHRDEFALIELGKTEVGELLTTYDY